MSIINRLVKKISDRSLRAATPEDGVVWITGASSGIGKALAQKMADEGWVVIASARSLDVLQQLQADNKNKIWALQLDVTDAKACAQAILNINAKHGPIALAVLNAGIYRPVHAHALDLKEFDISFDVNLRGVTNCLVPLTETLKQNKNGDFAGQIVMTSSVAGYSGLPTSAAYGATKAGLINMAESLRLEYEEMGILLQLVNPGFVDTPATQTNKFAMPALMSVDKAAARMFEGLKTTRFEITFPRRFTYVLKFMRLLPYWAYFYLTRKTTGRGAGGDKAKSTESSSSSS